MTPEFSEFTARLRRFIYQSSVEEPQPRPTPKSAAPVKVGAEGNSPTPANTAEFNTLALDLFALQSEHNAPYRRLCEARRLSPGVVGDWREIPAVPSSAFKELELSCLWPGQRSRVIHSSGTTGQQPSRHFHNAASLAVYETSLVPWFRAHLLPQARRDVAPRIACLTPSPAQAPHSSLVHMFETVRRELGAVESVFFGRVEGDETWGLEFEAVLEVLRAACDRERPLLLLGTAFSFVHLLDRLGEGGLHFRLPTGSRVMETGGYKGRSRSMPKAELHALITERLGVTPRSIVCEYGMSELSSQAYDQVAGDEWQVARCGSAARPSSLDPRPSSCHLSLVTRHFHFPPWARMQVVSPETGQEVDQGQTGLIRVFDLANVFSVMAIQTEDLGIRRCDGFELLGRAMVAEPRGCSLMAT
jgi:hypothetical protein